MILSFGDTATEDIYHGNNSKEARTIPREIWRVAFRKIDMINFAKELKDLLVPPGNRLEALKGGWAGFHSIRVIDHSLNNGTIGWVNFGANRGTKSEQP